MYGHTPLQVISGGFANRQSSIVNQYGNIKTIVIIPSTVKLMNEQLPYSFTEPIIYSNPARALTHSETFRILLFWFLHIPLGLVVRLNSVAATLHAGLVLGLGLFVLFRNRRPEHLIYVVCYIAAAEPLWRTRAYVNYEFSKYAVSFLLILAAILQQRLLKANKLPILYFLLLLPAILVLPAFDREAISFNLSGPFTIAVAVFYFSTVRLDRRQMKNLLYIVVAPIVAVAGIAFFSIMTADQLTFVQASNNLAAGGDGANQISAMLGLGAVLAFSAAVTYNEHRLLRLAFFGLTVWFLSQSALTFSRGGLFAAVGAIGLAYFLLLQDRQLRGTLLFWSIIFAGLGGLVFFPLLDNFTGGQLSLRVQDPDTTGRGDVAAVDIQLFLENPWLGLGPGQSDIEHARLFRVTRAHTEYTRMLAEHGSFGLVAMLFLFAMTVWPLLRPASVTSRSYKIIFVAWGLVTLAHVATRMAIPGLILGLGVADLALDGEEGKATEMEKDTFSRLSFAERLQLRMMR